MDERLTLEGYRTPKWIGSGSRADTFTAVGQQDDRPVVIKLYRRETGTASIDREVRALRASEGPGVPRIIEVVVADGRTALVLELAPGRTLAQQLEDGPVPIESLLGLAIDLATLLQRLHEARVMHCRIEPRNVLVDGRGHGHLIGFGAATFVGEERRTSAERLHSTTAALYMSPEASGRMGRGIDLRSDLYSLGAALYHAACGVPPFAATNPLELLHAHMAQRPRPLASVGESVPATFSKIVMRLLEKEPEDRYQTARSLADDLVRCRDLIARGDGERASLLGANEAPSRPMFPRRLHGCESRERELVDALSRCALGRSELYVVRGALGTGKSALAEGLRTHANERGGYFAVGKFDSYRRDVPCLGWVSAFQSVLDQRLKESEERLSGFAARLRSALGGLASTLADVLPDLSFVLEDLSPAPRLEPAQIRERLALAVQRFLIACAPPEEPLVLVLDDLQWADGASLYFLERLCLAELPCALLLIANLRTEDETCGAGDSEQTLARISAHGGTFREITLGPISTESCERMLAEALQRDVSSTRPLAQVVRRKTANAPLLVREFIDHVHDLGLLTYVPECGWTWDETAIESVEVPENAVAFIADRVRRVGGSARRVLEIASCIGDHVDPALLARTGEHTPSEIAQALDLLRKEGLIRNSESGLRFVHDRIREGAQALLTDGDRARIHLRLARSLRDSGPDGPAGELELADHFNRALSLLDADERRPVIRVNLNAANRALGSGAPSTARVYLEHARALIHAADWSEDASVPIEVYLRSAACAYQLGDSQACLGFLDSLDGRPLTLIQRALVTAQRVGAHAVGYDVARATDIALTELRRLGVRLPLHPSRLRTYLSIARLDLALIAGATRRYHPTAAQAPHDLSVLLLCAAVGGPAARVSPLLVSLIAAQATRRILRRGYPRGPQLAFAALGANMCGLFADGRRAARYGMLAEELARGIPDAVNDHRAQVVLHGHLYPWLKPRVQAVEALLPVIQRAREMGDREYALYGSALRTYTRVLSGIPLSDAERELAVHNRDFAAEMYARELSLTTLGILRGSHPIAHLDECLRGIDAEFEGRAFLSLYARVPLMLSLCVLGRFEETFAQSEHLVQAPSIGTMNADLAFLRGLAAAARCRARGSHARSARRVLRECTRKLSRWARHGPDFGHMAELLRAEQAALDGRESLARARYMRAAQRAQQRGYVHHAALAAERGAAFLQLRRRRTEALQLLRQARQLYEQWGANNKCSQLASQDALEIDG